MSQIIVKQQFHYTAKMTSKKHFPNAIYENYDAKLLPAAGNKACFAHKIFTMAKIFINSAPVHMILEFFLILSLFPLLTNRQL